MKIEEAAGQPAPTDVNRPDLSRRAFVRSAVGAVVIGVAATAGFSQLTESPVFAAPAAGRAAFERAVGKRFTNKTNGMSALTLVKVRSLRYVPDAVSRTTDSFSLVFRGPADRPLAQDVYKLHHRQTGDVSVLITPLQAETNSRFYEVVFNRAVPR